MQTRNGTRKALWVGMLTLVAGLIFVAGTIAQNTACYKDQGGAAWKLGSGCVLTVLSGGSIDASAATGLVTLAAGEIAAADLATDAVETVKIKDANVTQVKIAANALDGTIAKDAADANVIGGLMVLHRVDVADGATADVDVTLTHKTRVLDVWLVKTAAAGGASDTITVKNGATAITDAMDINVADKIIVRAGTIDDAQHEIAAAGTLRVTRTKSSANNVACTVYVLGLRVA